MGAKQVVKEYRKGPYDITRYQTTHLWRRRDHGDRSLDQRAEPLSAKLGRPEPVCDRRQRLPQNPGYNPTGTVAALAYWAADAIRNNISSIPVN